MYLEAFKLKNFRKFYKENDKDNNNGFFEIKFTKEEKSKRNNVNLIERIALLIGQNNTGKTTVANALKKVINLEYLEYSDINYTYLNSIQEVIDNTAKIDIKTSVLPKIEFQFIVNLDDNTGDYTNKFQKFMNIMDLKSSFPIKVVYEFQNSQDIINEIIKGDKKINQIIKNEKLVAKVFDRDSNLINIKLNELFKLKYIRANNVTNNDVLSKSFDKILKYEFQGEETLKESITEINNKIDKGIIEKHNKKYVSYLSGAVATSKASFKLQSNITKENIIQNILKYYYMENDEVISEDRFGLGYTRLILILSEILEYYSNYNIESVESSINLIFIEEPELYMHPQLQKNFIKNLNKLVNDFLTGKHHNINSQIILSTHSSHIANAKIEFSEKLDNLNYIYNVNSRLINVKNIGNKDLVTEEDKDSKNITRFLLKYMKNNLSELFYSDAVIFVEGITEKMYLRDIIDKNPYLRLHYISIFIVGGAYAHKYDSLIKALDLPTAVITDLDIASKDVNKSKNISVITNETKTTNSSLYKNKSNSDNLLSVLKWIREQDYNENLRYFSQNIKINGFYATSFEEALILTNCETKKYKFIRPSNKIRHSNYGMLYKKIIRRKKTRINIFRKRQFTSNQNKLSTTKTIQEIITSTFPKKYSKEKLNLPFQSREIQKNLEGDYKTKFSNKLLEEINNGELLIIPKYIGEALLFIEKKLKERE